LNRRTAVGALWPSAVQGRKLCEPTATLSVGNNCEHSELAALLASCRDDASPAGVRDAVVGLAYLSGARRAELVALHLADVDTDPS
jgi:site-specific recombinase XerD